ncbi:hypothetical protein C5C07_20620, partial [Haloferax sp. Atlit-4N]|uniref:hypothetical protein n=1 Tax=Haloferax sp. Atlit-4N TaxID=2077206 RepID=UPI000E3AC87F
GEARRLGLEPVGEVDERTVVVLTDSALERGERALGAAHRLGVDPPLELFEEQASLLPELVERNRRPDGSRLVSAVRSIGTKVVLDDAYADRDRGRISAPALELVRKLDPAVTVPARIAARLGAGSGRLPSWVRPGWFDDLRIEPVMAHPRFRYPMYE